MSIKVLLADDQTMVRKGFRMILELEPDIEIIGETEDGKATVLAVENLRPDVVLMDIQMPMMDGLEATRKIIQSPDGAMTRVLILTTFERDEYVFEALRSGASGFLLKNAPPEDLIRGVRLVAEGNALLAPSVTRRIIEEFTRRPMPNNLKNDMKQLTGREVEVLRLVGRGKNNSEIAADLFIGEATVKTHVSNLLTKLGLRDRVQAVVFAYKSDLIQRGSE
jgi:DNA-binding NarL/FixJ family response regulator